ncbi:unnamed protein product [Rotaria socialis]
MRTLDVLIRLGNFINIEHARGCEIPSHNEKDFAAAIELARSSDIVFFFGGIDHTQVDQNGVVYDPKTYYAIRTRYRITKHHYTTFYKERIQETLAGCLYNEGTRKTKKQPIQQQQLHKENEIVHGNTTEVEDEIN